MAVEVLLLLSFPIREFRDPSILHVGERGRKLLLIQGRIIASSLALLAQMPRLHRACLSG